MTLSRYSMTLTFSLAASMVLSGNSEAQKETNNRTAVLEEVIVTAQRREETVQSTPLSITVLSAQDILKRGIAVNDRPYGAIPGSA